MSRSENYFPWSKSAIHTVFDDEKLLDKLLLSFKIILYNLYNKFVARNRNEFLYNHLCKYSCGIITRITVQRFWSALRALYKLNLSIILRRSHVEDLNTDLFAAKVLIRGPFMLLQALRNSSLVKLESIYGTFGRC